MEAVKGHFVLIPGIPDMMGEWGILKERLGTGITVFTLLLAFVVTPV